MIERDRQLVLLIGAVTKDYVDGEFGLSDLCRNLEALLVEIRSGAVRKAFAPALLALCEVRNAIGETRGLYHTFDVSLETWAVKQIEALVGEFGTSQSRPSQAG